MTTDQSKKVDAGVTAGGMFAMDEGTAAAMEHYQATGELLAADGAAVNALAPAPTSPAGGRSQAVIGRGGWLLVAHGDQPTDPCHLTWCTTVPEVVQAVRCACWVTPEQADEKEAFAIAGVLLEEGIMRFEGDGSLQLLRVDDAGQAARLGRLPSIAVRDVMHERRRQVALGFDAEHDDVYRDGELRQAAKAYLEAEDNPGLFPARQRAPACWPWDLEWWKPRHSRANLVRAAALLLAQIEHGDRAHAVELQARAGDREQQHA